MVKTKRFRRFRIISLSTLIPNLITVMALCSGLTAIRFGLEQRWEFAVGAIVLAAVLDMLDGHMARLLKGQSRFGAELDSLSDFICFGVTPALILFLWSTQQAGGFGWMTSLFYAICMALRLARFNTSIDNTDRPAFTSRFFTGVPAPGAAGLAILPLVLSFEIGRDIISHPHAVASWLILIGLMTVSTVPTYAFKGIKVPQKLLLPVVIAGALGIAGFLSAPWMTLSCMIGLYVCSIPLSIRSFRRLSALHETNQSRAASGTDARDAGTGNEPREAGGR